MTVGVVCRKGVSQFKLRSDKTAGDIYLIWWVSFLAQLALGKSRAQCPAQVYRLCVVLSLCGMAAAKGKIGRRRAKIFLIEKPSY